jgi:uncharacterized protein (DUF433 family)
MGKKYPLISEEEIMGDYPALEEEDILACLAYASQITKTKTYAKTV